MRVGTTIFITTLLIGSVAYAGDAAPERQAANAPRSASTMRTVDLSEVVNPSDMFGEAKVEDVRGLPIGQVQRIVTGDSGTITRVDVALKTTQPQKVVTLTPAQVRYVPFTGKLRATMTADQLGSLPAAK